MEIGTGLALLSSVFLGTAVVIGTRRPNVGHRTVQDSTKRWIAARRRLALAVN
jgi:hypothetical protein